jgi:hypothetical protein
VNAAGSAMNVTATNLRLSADDNIATSDRHLTTTVDTLSALSAGTDTAGIFITETDSISIDSVALSVTNMNVDATTTVITDEAQSDLTTLGSNGHIVLTTTSGSIVINEGLDNDTGISAQGAGNILLDANGSASDITVNADIQSSTGHITLTAADAINLNADLSTAADGTISIDAQGGDLLMAGSTSVTATNSSVRLSAANNVVLSNISAADVSVVADAGSIVNSAGSTMNISATNLRLQADDAIGSNTRHLTTTVETLTGLNTGSDAAGIFITEADDLTIDNVTAEGVVNISAVDISIGTISATSLALSGASFINKEVNTAAKITADNVTLITDDTSNVSSTLNIDGQIKTLTAMTSMQTLSLQNANDLILSSITMDQGNLIVDVKGNLTQVANMSLTNTNAQLISDSLFAQNADVQADDSTLTVKASTISQSVDSLVTTNSALSYQATQGDISLARVNSQGVVKLETTGKVFSVLDSATATNVTAKKLIFTSEGHFVDHENSGFINAAIALEKNLLKVNADIFVGEEINGNVRQVSDSSDKNYLVNEADDSQNIYLQFLSQSTQADYSEIAEDKLSPTQMELALSRFVGSEITETDTSSTATSSEPTSLLARLLQQVQSIEENKTNVYGVDNYNHLSDNAEDIFQENQSAIDGSGSIAKTQFERQLEGSVLSTSSIPQVMSEYSQFVGDNQSKGRNIGSLSFNIVNPVGNRQIDVLGDSLNHYLYDYLLDTEEDVLLGRIL